MTPSADVEVLVPYPPNQRFVGREGILKSMNGTLELHKRSEARKFRKLALYGLGGIG